jgi:hypothetical protein
MPHVAQDLATLDDSLSVLDRGIVTGTSTVISLLGLDLLAIRQIKVVTTIDTWLHYSELLW